MKKLGFNEMCFAVYYLNGERIRMEYTKKDDPVIKVSATVCAAPLWQQAVNWLRETRGLVVYITPVHEILPTPKFIGFQSSFTDEIFETYERAIEAGILKALDSIS